MAFCTFEIATSHSRSSEGLASKRNRNANGKKVTGKKRQKKAGGDPTFARAKPPKSFVGSLPPLRRQIVPAFSPVTGISGKGETTWQSLRNRRGL